MLEKCKYKSLPIIRRWDASARLDIHRREVSDEIMKILSNLRYGSASESISANATSLTIKGHDSWQNKAEIITRISVSGSTLARSNRGLRLLSIEGAEGRRGEAVYRDDARNIMTFFSPAVKSAAGKARKHQMCVWVACKSLIFNEFFPSFFLC